MAKKHQPQDKTEKAPFDDCRAALSFALNADQVVAPTAYMNKAMAAVRVEMKKPKKKRDLGNLEFLNPDLMGAEQLLEMEHKRLKNKRSGSLVRVEALRFRDGMDRHHLAGLILHHFGRLDYSHQVVLTGLVCNSYVPCSCRNLCCRGRRPTERWLKALSEMCVILQMRAEPIPGKKGLSSQPELRRRVVEEFFVKEGLTLTDIMRGIRISYTTAAQHRVWITEYLEALEDAAWHALAPLFEQAGITGHHL